MNFDEVVEKVLQFRDDRDWKQFHNPKDLAVSISIEAAELLEVFQWSGPDTERVSKTAEIKEELADIMIYCIYLADKLDVNLVDIIGDKIIIDDEKYPADKARGNARKYTEL